LSEIAGTMASMNPDALVLAAPVCTTGESGIIGAMTNWLVELMEQAGGIGVGIAIALESVFPPIPSEIILPLAGFTAARGRLSIAEAIIWATIGSVVGAWILYGVSRLIGLERINRIADRIPGTSRKDVEKADRWFVKYGTWSVLFGRIIPIVRSLISIPAGLNKMNFLRFTGWTMLGSALWNSLLIGLGYALGGQWCSILSVLSIFENVVIVVIAIGILLLIARWLRNLVQERRHQGASRDTGGASTNVRDDASRTEDAHQDGSRPDIDGPDNRHELGGGSGGARQGGD
jgi:membrane protein DedA with SNARE-associated domain